MHPTLHTVFDLLGPGLLWLEPGDSVRFCNRQAADWTGLRPGSRTLPPPLRDALARMRAGRKPVSLTLTWAGSPDRCFACRALPGLAGDDAVVLLEAEGGVPADGGLETLLTLIRSDLAAPLDVLNRALQQEADRDAGLASADLLAMTRGLLSDFERLLDLAQVFGNHAIHPTERIELGPLLDRVWAAVEPLARARGLTIRVGGMVDGQELATVYGNAALLERVVVECLESVLRGASARGTVDVTVRQLGPRVLIAFRDCGLFAARRTDLKALALERRPPPPHGVRLRDTIGLQLCQRIVALHGGTLREDPGDDGHDFLIDLPTGAPAHDTGTSLDAQQAARYARDLADLLGRAPRGAAALSSPHRPVPATGTVTP